MSRILAILIMALAVASWGDPTPLSGTLGNDTAWASTGLLGSALAIAAMRGQRRMRWPLGIAALAGIGVAVGVWLPQSVAGDPDEFLSAQVALGSGAIMGLAAFVALAVWQRPERKSTLGASSASKFFEEN